MEEDSPIKNAERRRPVLKNKKYAPATGIQSDFEKVLTTFVETKSVRYEEFAKIWREKKLSLICAGRQSDREAKEFMEECMKVAFKMFLPPYGFQARVGALYLLYGLYMTQPCLPKVKIRVTQPDWNHIKNLQDEFFKQSHHDTNFILQKLLLDGAFLFCAVSEEPRSRYNQAEDTNKSMVEVLREDRQRIDELFSEEVPEHLSLVHNRYHQQKVRLAGPDASRPDRSLDVLHDKFPGLVTEQLKKHHEQWKQKEASRRGNRSHPLPTIPESGESEGLESNPDFQGKLSVGQRRARLKAMAYRGAKSKSRYRHRPVATETSSSEEKNLSSPEKKKRGRPRGAKAVTSIQRATMSSISEQEEDSAVAVETNQLLDMPHFEEMPSEDKRVGRKRKASPHKDGSSSSSKQQKTTDKAHSANTSKEVKDEVSGEAASTKRGRGRPPKSKPISLVRTGKVGRPPKPKLPVVLQTRKVGRPPKPNAPLHKDKAGQPPKSRPTIPVRTGKVGRPRKERNQENKGATSVDSMQPCSTKVSHSTSSQLDSSENTNAELSHTLRSESSPSTSLEPARADERVSTSELTREDDPAGTDEIASAEMPIVEKDSTDADPECHKVLKGPKRSSTGNKEDSSGKSKVGKKGGQEGQKEGPGKGARLKVKPLQVLPAGKGKKTLHTSASP